MTTKAEQAKSRGEFPSKDTIRVVSDDGDGQGRGSNDSGPVKGRNISSDVDNNSYQGSGPLRPAGK
jgi:hypothetical protein